MSTEQHNMFVRYAPMLARRINAINGRYVGQMSALLPFDLAAWRQEIDAAVLEALAHMEKAVDHYRQLAIEAQRMAGPPVWEIKGTALGKKFEEHASKSEEPK
jgi:hypothetical protein